MNSSVIDFEKLKRTDIEKTKELEETLRSYGIFESNEEFILRLKALKKLNRFFKFWIKKVSDEKNISSENVGGQIYTFGSFRLGVHDKNADIDVLCVAPKYIKRSDFFTTFFDLLQKRTNVKEARAIGEAYIPLIKMNFDGIDFDLVFASLNCEITEDLDITDPKVLRDLDPKCALSLSGFKVTERILNSVPNVNHFQTVLHAVKLWAKTHNIYSNGFGYLGGISWAILVARVCQFYPNALPAFILYQMFYFYTNWKWSFPILLNNLEDLKLGLKSWDFNTNLKTDSMQIITPEYPYQNSAFNVTNSTRYIILNEMYNGLRICDKVFKKMTTWECLFDKVEILNNYPHYLVLSGTAKLKEDQVKLNGLIESKMRYFVNSVDRLPYVLTCQASLENYSGLGIWCIGLILKQYDIKKNDFQFSFQKFINHVNESKNFDSEIKLDLIERKDIYNHLTDLTKCAM